jgi:hypothetical protein
MRSRQTLLNSNAFTPKENRLDDVILLNSVEKLVGKLFLKELSDYKTNNC